MIKKFYDMEAGEPSAAYQDAQPATKADVKEVVGVLMEAMKDKFDKDQKEPNQYVVAYYDKDKLLGYHADSFCNLTQKIERGKRYHGDNPYNQLKTIRENLDYTLLMTEEKAAGTIFGKMNLLVRETHFPNLTKDDVFIEATYLDEGVPPQRFVWKEITAENG